jgi:hypothetical protein
MGEAVDQVQDRMGATMMEDWKPPETVEEVMLRGAEFASREDAWQRKAWIVAKDLHQEPKDVTCGDVRACAVGILAIVLFDGELIKRYMLGTMPLSIQEMVVNHPLGPASTRVLARALVEVLDGALGMTEDRKVSYTRCLERQTNQGTMDVVISCNDRVASTSSQIVAAFERGAELARADAAVLVPV